MISSPTPSLKIQIMGGKITENLGFESPLQKVKTSFVLVFFSFSILHTILGYWFFQFLRLFSWCFRGCWIVLSYLTIKQKEGQQETTSDGPIVEKEHLMFFYKSFLRSNTATKEEVSKKTTLYLALQTCFYFSLLLMVTFFLLPSENWIIFHDS